MDTVSHALWGKALFGYRKYKWSSFIFGALPDLLSFGLYFLFNLITSPSNIKFGKPALETIPYWVFDLYDFSHSLIIAFIFILITSLFDKELCFPMLAWPLHILIDLFTHSVQYFPTPFFWPISDYRFDGIPWSNPYILILNFAFIFLLFIYRYRRKIKVQL